MPGFKFVLGHAESLIERGISAREAKDIYQNVTGQWGSSSTSNALTTSQKGQLLKLSEAFSDFFTTAGAKAWHKYTGIQIAPDGSVTPPTGFMPRSSLLSLRAAIATEQKRLGATYVVSRVGSRVDVDYKTFQPTAATLAKIPKAKNGFWKVHATRSGRYGMTLSWVFTDQKLAALAMENIPRQGYTRVRISGQQLTPDSRWRHKWNPKGPKYA